MRQLVEAVAKEEGKIRASCAGKPVLLELREFRVVSQTKGETNPSVV